MTTKHVTIRTRVDQEVKDASEHIFHQLGLTTTEAIRLFLAQVTLRGGLPFRVEIPSHSEEDELLLPPEMRQSALDAIYDD
jgi:DNA-damage-inducible protein J